MNCCRPYRRRAPNCQQQRVFLRNRTEQVAVSTPRAPATLDLVLVADEVRNISAYTIVARLFRGRVNLHIAWKGHDVETLLRTLGSAEVIDQGRAKFMALAGEAGEIVRADMIGCVRPRQIHVNIAREYLKSIDWSARFCAVSVPSSFPEVDVLAALAKAEAAHLNWRFILLGERVGTKLLRHSPSLIAPSHSGLELSVQLALAMEADAYLGSADVFGVAALLGGRPVTFLSDNRFAQAVAIDVELAARIVLQPSVESLRQEIDLLIARLNSSG